MAIGRLDGVLSVLPHSREDTWDRRASVLGFWVSRGFASRRSLGRATHRAAERGSRSNDEDPWLFAHVLSANVRRSFIGTTRLCRPPFSRVLRSACVPRGQSVTSAASEFPFLAIPYSERSRPRYK